MIHQHKILTALLFGLASPAPSSALPQEGGAAMKPWFTEVAKEAGVTWSHVSDRTDRFRFPEIMGGGTALFDYDGDGDLDLYLVQGGVLTPPPPPAEGEAPAPTPPGNKLFRNDSAGGLILFTDVTDEAGVGDTTYGMGAACADFDRDGDIDLYVTNVGPNKLYVNNGNGTFTDQSKKLKVDDARWATSAVFFDADGKNGLDLYVVNNLGWSEAIETPCVNYYGEPDYCSPNNYNAPSVDVLYMHGRLGYGDATIRAGIEAGFGNGLGVTVGDYDNDGDADVYVANDATPNVLWRNDGAGKFEDIGLEVGCAVNGLGAPEAGMGVQFIDMDSDGHLDLYMTHLRRETNTFYRNLGNGKFSDKTNMTGTSRASLNMTGFGMGFHDFDHDGVLDLFVANGAVQAWKDDERFSKTDAYAEPNHLYRGQMRGKNVRLSLVQEEGATANPVIGTSRGAAFGDLDGDGDVDAVVVDLDANVEILRNDAPAAGTHWVGFRVVEEKRGKLADVHGARVSIAGMEEGTRQQRQAEPCYSYLSSNDPRVHFGLGAGEMAKDVRVRWPDGTEQAFGDLAAGQYHVLKRGE
ncbi:ASPIC and UnbV [Planctomycetes bacterium Poly30]|uniref:ASPIC and UnbV n=1 Tax=Saltatorellus ferox TaxID=2528018 RepID=A0A518EYA2_9BACT|nr:ASPIC and UnbV [Planctomycetes bacterium Poly30]